MSARSSLPRASALLVVLLASLGAFGCAENSILEMEIWMPASTVGAGTYRYALTLVRPLPVADCGDAAEVQAAMDISWGVPDPNPIQLRAEERVECTSVVSDREIACLGAKVHFCQTDNCSGDDMERVPQAWYAIEHPFYTGRRTFFRTPRSTTALDGSFVPSPLHQYLDAPSEPTEPVYFPVGRCGVVGCIGGTPANGCDATGQHFCESNGNQDLAPDDACDN